MIFPIIYPLVIMLCFIPLASYTYSLKLLDAQKIFIPSELYLCTPPLECSKEKFVIPAAKTRGKGFTVYGAISSCLKKRNSYFTIGDSTNKIDFISFMQGLKSQIKVQNRDPKPILIIGKFLFGLILKFR